MSITFIRAFFWLLIMFRSVEVWPVKCTLYASVKNQTSEVWSRGGPQTLFLELLCVLYNVCRINHICGGFIIPMFHISGTGQNVPNGIHCNDNLLFVFIFPVYTHIWAWVNVSQFLQTGWTCPVSWCWTAVGSPGLGTRARSQPSALTSLSWTCHITHSRTGGR